MLPVAFAAARQRRGSYFSFHGLPPIIYNVCDQLKVTNARLPRLTEAMLKEAILELL